MCPRDFNEPIRPNSKQTVAFRDAEEAWFWFISAQQASHDGARFTAGAGLYPRPCEPLDILKVLDRLHRQRRLLRDHLLVLRHYGRRHMAPDPRRAKEYRAHTLWLEALQRIEAVLLQKEIVAQKPVPSRNWFEEATILQNQTTTKAREVAHL